ncbi:acyl-CoA dehydrogenase family protein [Sphingomicrobium lutaoense]|uniref:Alkylation response protein AidB-like acyl-CoA dehydrogenase n=1 Tax=Sphingomicrobium lutaoense TaxID=515949 RepID=A0A839Z3A6_9SPHN|nr:acyl-CoA dehydrogenase [Sphingomicrobium lutaoense]MBB3763064.1 alkylation response protein AidB-like acyl-CoA dehydrogenase [Sphingomicrobium lutaoense]
MTDWLDWPFFEDEQRRLARELGEWSGQNLVHSHGKDVDAECRTIVVMLGRNDFLEHCVARGGQRPSVRNLAVARATLAYQSGLADFTFAMQGLGSGAISLFGTAQQREAWLPRVGRGQAIAAFALTEPDTGSDAARIATSAVREGDEWVLNGEKSFISNGTIADVLTIFARTGSAEEGARGLSAFVLPMATPGIEIAERIETIAPHPLARLKLDNVRLPASALLGEEGRGFAIAMQTLNLFRVTVGAAALGFARRALDEAIAFTKGRPLGDAMLADHPVTQARLAEMALSVDGSALLIARAAYEQDKAPEADHRRAAAMAKLHATEEAQKVIDAAVQLHGGLGVTKGSKVEELYREIRALRIYEGASEVQRQIIGKDLVK